MNPSNLRRQPNIAHRLGWIFNRWLFVFSACSGVPALAQSVIQPVSVPAPQIPPASPSTVPTGTRTPAVTALPKTTPFEVAGLEFRPHINYQFVYGDGIQGAPGSSQKTAVHTLSPGLGLSGGRWSADYTPIWTFYSNRVFHDAFAQRAQVSAQDTFEGALFTASDHYESSDDPRIETGRQTKRHSNITTVGAEFQLGQKTALQTSVSQSLRAYEVAPNERESSGHAQLDYHFTNKIGAGVGFDVGYISENAPGIDMSYVRPQASLTWRPTDKLFLEAHFGNEQRKFHIAGAESLTTPTFGISANYQLLEVTSFSFTANQSVGSGITTNTVTQDTTWRVGFSQRLLRRLHFDAGLGHNRNRYVQTGGLITSTRGDESTVFSASLSTNPLRRGNVSLTYQRAHNTSSINAFSFTSNQIGFEIGYQY